LKRIKLSALNQKEKQNALNEVRFLASIQNTYIVSYKEAFYDDNINCLCIVMEYASQGDLQSLVQENINFKR
jgi:NIMA (never in mitosis gene a)-related kinase